MYFQINFITWYQCQVCLLHSSLTYWSRYAKRPNHETFNENDDQKKYGGRINMVNGVELIRRKKKFLLFGSKIADWGKKNLRINFSSFLLSIRTHGCSTGQKCMQPLLCGIVTTSEMARVLLTIPSFLALFRFLPFYTTGTVVSTPT